MNKVDQFVHIHDFARAYGSLCWNLSKVIPRKDLPRIYTMYLPISALKDRPRGHKAAEMAPLARALAELEGTREEVLHAVHSAPERRIDNLITQTHDQATMLRIHALVADEARAAHSTQRNRFAALGGGVLFAGPAAGAFMWLELGATWQTCVGISVVGMAGALLVALKARHSLQVLAADILSDAGMDALFRHRFHIELSEGDEFIMSLWRRIRPHMQRSLRTLSLAGVPKPSHVELSDLNAVLQSEVPALRRLASPRQEIPQRIGGS